MSTTDPESRSLFDDGVLIGERYRVVRFIARGGMGLVYEVEDEKTSQRLALKALKPELARLKTSLERFRREIALSRRIQHPNVCKIYEAGQHAVRPKQYIRFFTMELLLGKTLSEVLEEHGQMSVEEAEPIVRQLVSGLGAAHRAGVAHRDFKPSNVILVPDGGGSLRAVITDFGLARNLVADEATLSQTLTQTGQLMGTPAYFAPELLEGKRVQGAGDFYALGVVVYEMLTGKLPFTGRTPLVMALKRLREPAIPLREHLPQVPRVWDRMVKTCLQRYPKQRFSSADELLALFDSAGPSRPSTTRIVNTLLSKKPAPVEFTAEQRARSLESTLKFEEVRDESPAEVGRGWGRWLWPGLVLVALLALGLAVAWSPKQTPTLQGPASEPTYVALLPLQVERADDTEALKLHLALQRVGHRIPGLRLVESSWPGAAAGASTVEDADAAVQRLQDQLAVDEVVRIDIGPRDGSWRADLSRRSGAEELWQRSSSVAEQPQQWSHALTDSLWTAYGRSPKRPGLGARFEIGTPDLAALGAVLKARQTAWDEEDWMQLLDDLEALGRRVPYFLEVHLLTADLHLEACRARRQASCLGGARRSVESAALVAPGDLRVFLSKLRWAVLSEDPEAIEAAAEALAEVSPGDVELDLSQAALAWHRGQLQEAVTILQRAAEKRPLWPVLTALAEAQQRSGDPDAAAQTVAELRRRSADDAWLAARCRSLEAKLVSLEESP